MNKHKKVCLVTPIFPPDVGGPASYVFELAQRLKKQVALSVVGFSGGKPARIKGVELGFVNPHKFGFVRRQWKLRRLLRAHGDCDFMYIQGPVVVGVNALRYALRRGIPTALKFVGDIAWEDASRRMKTELKLEEWLNSNGKDFRSWFIQRVQKWSFAKTDKVVVPSEFLKRLLMEHYEVPENKIELVFNAFDGRKTKMRRYDDRAFRVMVAGRLVPHKNVNLVLEAMAQLPEEYELDVYGDGPERRELMAKVHAFELEGRVHFHGNVSQGDLFKAMQAHDLFVLYSSYEGLPHVVLEAFAARVPVVASDIPGTDEVARDDETAVLAAPDNANRLAEAIRNLSWDRQRREKLVSGGVRLLKSEFSWDTHLEKLKALL